MAPVPPSKSIRVNRIRRNKWTSRICQGAAPPSEVSSFLSDPFHTFENRLLPNDVILIRNIGECHEGLRGRGGGDDDQQGRPTETEGPVQQKPEARSNMISSPPQPPGLVCLKLVT